jgi:voltage-gated potassium channel
MSGNNMDESQPKEIKNIEKDIKVLHPVRSLFLVDVIGDPDSRPVLLWALAALAAGTLIYHWLEGWNLLDALYFCVITLATVGYGDLTPTTPLAKAFTIVYVINGVVILLAFFDRIRVVRARRVEKTILGSSPTSQQES